jgi:hypothetical protein
MEDRRRMEQGEQGSASHADRVSRGFGDSGGPREKRLDRMGAQRDDPPGIQNLDLPVEVGSALTARRRVEPVRWGPALDQVEDPERLDRRADRRDGLVEALAGPAHKGDPYQVLLGSGGLPDEQDPGAGGASIDGRKVTGGMKRASNAGADLSAESLPGRREVRGGTQEGCPGRPSSPSPLGTHQDPVAASRFEPPDAPEAPIERSFLT